MLTKFFGVLRAGALSKVNQIDTMSESGSLLLREAGFEALACVILDAFGSLPELQAVSIILDTPSIEHHCSEAATLAGARDLLISVSRPVRIETVGTVVEEWSDATDLLGKLLPLSKVGAGTLKVTRNTPAVQHFLATIVNNTVDVDVSDYRVAVQALAALADHSFGHCRIVDEAK